MCGDLIGIKKSDMRYFELAKREADKSTFPRFHVGCVVVYGGHVIGSGTNSEKSDTIQARYNRYRHFNNSETHVPVNHAIHAEIAALKSIPYPVAQQIDWRKVRTFTYRICVGHDSGKGYSRPCAACMNYIHDLGIRQVFYTTDRGYAAERLES